MLVTCTEYGVPKKGQDILHQNDSGDIIPVFLSSLNANLL